MYRFSTVWFKQGDQFQNPQSVVIFPAPVAPKSFGRTHVRRNSCSIEALRLSTKNKQHCRIVNSNVEP